MYLSETEFLKLTGVDPMANYKELEMRASAELDTVTRFHYQFNELGNDFKSNQFRRALATQILFFDESETTSSEAMNAKPDSVRIGNTTVSYNRSSTTSENNKRTSALSQDALNLLSGTGLLYRGVQYGY